MSEIKKIIDERKTQKTKKQKKNNNNKNNKKNQRRTRGQSYSERVSAKWFCCAFKLGFLQLICKASLIFKANLELALSIILKERELYESKHVAVECRCLKIEDLLSFLTCSSILVLKLFLFATSQTHFILNNKFYNQIDGVAMGFPLAPVLANIFIGFYESK